MYRRWVWVPSNVTCDPRGVVWAMYVSDSVEPAVQCLLGSAVLNCVSNVSIWNAWDDIFCWKANSCSMWLVSRLPVITFHGNECSIASWLSCQQRRPSTTVNNRNSNFSMHMSSRSQWSIFSWPNPLTDYRLLQLQVFYSVTEKLSWFIVGGNVWMEQCIAVNCDRSLVNWRQCKS